MPSDAEHRPLHDEWDAISLERVRTRSSYKWSPYADTDLIAAWVADMDLPASPSISSAIADFYRRGDLGYFDENLFETVRETAARRFERNYSWGVSPEHIELVGDVVQALHLSVRHYSAPGDRVALITPVYHHFFNAILENGRVPAAIELGPAAAGYPLDLERVRDELAKPGTAVLLLCHPHNPTGRVFAPTELAAIAAIAEQFGVVVVSDEIHADLTYDIERFVPFGLAAAGSGAQSITLTSAGKAFNVAGTHLGVMVHSDAQVRDLATRLPQRLTGKPGAAGCVATHVAWSSEEPWLIDARAYLRRNRDYLVTSLNEAVPALALQAPAATYLAWLDLSDFATDGAAFLREHARIVASSGADFSWPRGSGTGFARINFATSFPVVERITERLISALIRPTPQETSS